MTSIQAIILGIVQGFTEFLPVSSSAHLVIFQYLLGIKEHDLIFDIAVHLGTLASVVIIYYRLLWSLLKNWFKDPLLRTPNTQVIKWIFIAYLPTGIIGFSFKDHFEVLFSNRIAVGIFMCVTGLILYLTKWSKKTLNSDRWESLSIPQMKSMNSIKALIIGIAQGLAIAPGISRSGSTIAAALFLKTDRQTAAIFSFLLSIPAILGAALLESSKITNAINYTALLIGFFSSFLTGILGLMLILKTVKSGRLEFFSPYLWVVGIFFIWYSL